MASSDVALFSLYGLTALNWTVHWYTQMVTYRLFPDVAGRMSGADFSAYHRAYQTRLVWAVYIPWSLLITASIAVALAPPPGQTLWAWTLLVLNVAIGVLSFALAVPVHRRIDRDDCLEGSDAHRLLRANFARLVTASASLVICSVLALRAWAN